jgi:hypothetical protein
MATPKKRPGSTPGAKLINKGGASKSPNTAAKKARGGSNTKGTPKKR